MKNHLAEFVAIMKKHKLNDIVIKNFSTQYEKVLAGETGIISESDIKPPQKNNLIYYKDINDTSDRNLNKLVVFKLNGGLGTSMGLSRAKSLLQVKDDKTFLDIIALQILQLLKNSGKHIPLMFMNSFNTRRDTLKKMSEYQELKVNGLPLDFIQNKFPKIQQEDMAPLNSANDENNWNPPGHGEIYLVLQTSGILDLLLEKGYEYAFISNSDNLGAVVDNKILNFIAEADIPFLMEVCERTEMDKKGGHLAETKDGQLLLREVAQCPASELESFQDINKYKYFNTNNLWINLNHLKAKLMQMDQVFSLPLILNKKEVEGRKVFQIETAMGAAISCFKNSKALIVNRGRFVPVKKTNDLLCLWSDTYKLSPEYHLILDNKHGVSPVVELDENYYKNIDQLEERVIEIPSLKECKSLKIEGNVFLGKDVVFKNDVSIKTDKKILISNKAYS
ncbi:MAG: hypothetical protein APR54_05975 [Candidatus Cloacimonas sp. SDB]|nr:MAG: hypothetical protein APR54_05975 [Candidatus Cloacimonas sp. SDB]